jgi:tight adherence protein B
MNDREKLARLNALLSSGLSLQEAERASETATLGGSLGRHYQLIRELCLSCGAAPVPAMAELQAIAVGQAEADARLRLAAAMPKSSAKLVQWLPLAALLLGQVCGLGSLEILFSSALAAISFVIGIVFLLLANIASTRMIAKAQKVRVDHYVALDAFAMILRAGLSPTIAREKLLLSFRKVFEVEPSVDALNEIKQLVRLSEKTGAPIEKLLRARAAEIRFNLQQELLQKFEKLSVRLLIPLAIFVLPAFVFVSVIPISISLLSKT